MHPQDGTVVYIQSANKVFCYILQFVRLRDLYFQHNILKMMNNEKAEKMNHTKLCNDQILGFRMLSKQIFKPHIMFHLLAIAYQFDGLYANIMTLGQMLNQI